MDDEEKRLFENAKTDMLKKVEPRDLLPALLTDGQITEMDRETVLKETTREDRVIVLLDILQRKLDNLTYFIEALRNNKYPELVRKLSAVPYADANTGMPEPGTNLVIQPKLETQFRSTPMANFDGDRQSASVSLLSQHIEFDPENDRYFISLDIESLQLLQGKKNILPSAEISRAGKNQQITHWHYSGNGTFLEEFFDIISKNEEVSRNCWVTAQNPFIRQTFWEKKSGEKNQRSSSSHRNRRRIDIQLLVLRMEDQLSPESSRNLAVTLESLFPHLHGLRCLVLSSTGGFSFPQLKYLLQNIPESVYDLGFRNLTLSEADCKEIAVWYQKQAKFVCEWCADTNPLQLALTMSPTDSTIEGYVSLLRNLNFTPKKLSVVDKVKSNVSKKFFGESSREPCGITKLNLQNLTLTEAEERRFISEIKKLSELQTLRLHSGRLRKSGKDALISVIRQCSLSELQVVDKCFDMGDSKAVEIACVDANVNFVRN